MDFSLKNRLIDSNLTFTTPIPLIFSLSSLLLSINRSTISHNCLTVTIYKLVSAIVVSVLNLDVVTAVKGVVTDAFSGIASTCRSFLP